MGNASGPGTLARLSSGPCSAVGLPKFWRDVSKLSPAPKPAVHARDKGFLDFVRSQACWACKQSGCRQHLRTEAAHIESRRYGDVENAIPLCGIHHRECKTAFHQLGREQFEEVWGLDLKAEAARLYRLYLAEGGRA